MTKEKPGVAAGFVGFTMLHCRIDKTTFSVTCSDSLFRWNREKALRDVVFSFEKDFSAVIEKKQLYRGNYTRLDTAVFLGGVRLDVFHSVRTNVPLYFRSAGFIQLTNSKDKTDYTNFNIALSYLLALLRIEYVENLETRLRSVELAFDAPSVQTGLKMRRFLVPKFPKFGLEDLYKIQGTLYFGKGGSGKQVKNYWRVQDGERFNRTEFSLGPDWLRSHHYSDPNAVLADARKILHDSIRLQCPNTEKLHWCLARGVLPKYDYEKEFALNSTFGLRLLSKTGTTTRQLLKKFFNDVNFPECRIASEFGGLDGFWSDRGILLKSPIRQGVWYSPCSA